MALPKTWKPIDVNDLIRIGSKYDGGYVVPARIVERTDVLVGLGLSDEWSFDADFAHRKNIRVFCYDHTVTTAFIVKRFLIESTKLFFHHKRRNLRKALTIFNYKTFFDGKQHRHIREKIGYAHRGDTDLHKIFGVIGPACELSVFFKIDIEGWEYRILKQIVEYSRYINGMAIEFHNVDIMRDTIDSFISKISPHMSVCHLHGNNGGGVDGNGDPCVVEMTFINNALLNEPVTQSARDYPLKDLDGANLCEHQDLNIHFA